MGRSALAGLRCLQSFRASVVPGRRTSTSRSSRLRGTRMPDLPATQGLYDPRNEHDACGVAFVVDAKGRPSHDIVEKGLEALCNLDHRGASGAEPTTGDGAGILVQIPDRFLRAVVAFDLPPAGSYST